jgi:hypothetical protein
LEIAQSRLSPNKTRETFALSIDGHLVRSAKERMVEKNIIVKA